MMDDMHEYGVYANAVEVHFNEEELEDSDVEEDHHATQNRARPYKNLIDAEQQQIYEAFLERSNHGRLKRKSTTVVAQLFKVSTPFVSK
jgi:protein required for attachment to host cells